MPANGSLVPRRPGSGRERRVEVDTQKTLRSFTKKCLYQLHHCACVARVLITSMAINSSSFPSLAALTALPRLSSKQPLRAARN
jgi:hypothetical protein